MARYGGFPLAEARAARVRSAHVIPSPPAARRRPARCRHRGHLRRRARAALRQPRLRREHAGARPEVCDAVDAFMPWYSSVHRGSGLKSQVATEAFEGTRDVVRGVRRRAGGRRRHLRAQHDGGDQRPRGGAAARAPACSRSPVEHHANMLPWRRHGLRLLPFTESPTRCATPRERALRRARRPVRPLAVTGASNVTGEVWPLARARRDRAPPRRAAVRRRRPARAAPRDRHGRRGHRLARPLGSQALRARSAPARWSATSARSATRPPLLRGGGAIKLVTADDVIWADGPERHEAGSPNVVGVVALGAACRALRALGMDAVAEHERALAARLRRGLAGVPGLEHAARSGRGERRPRRRRDLHAGRRTGTRCSPRSSAPSTRSASATAASARTR